MDSTSAPSPDDEATVVAAESEVGEEAQAVIMAVMASVSNKRCTVGIPLVCGS